MQGVLRSKTGVGRYVFANRNHMLRGGIDIQNDKPHLRAEKLCAFFAAFRLKPPMNAIFSLNAVQLCIAIAHKTFFSRSESGRIQTHANHIQPINISGMGIFRNTCQ